VPVGSVPGMRVPGRVFANDALIAAVGSDRALEQVANVATLPGIRVASMAMPDVHWGYGFPVGGVAATDVEVGGVVSPGGVGFDVCCGVRLLRSDLDAEEIVPRLPELVAELAERVPRGTGYGGLVATDGALLRDVLTASTHCWLVGSATRTTPRAARTAGDSRTPTRMR